MKQYTVTGMSCAACSARVEKAAPYPAFSTARMISCGAAVPSTPMEFVRRLTEQDVTPGTSDTAFSTRAETAGAAEAMPQEEMLKDRETPLLKKRLVTSVGFLAVLMY